MVDAWDAEKIICDSMTLRRMKCMQLSSDFLMIM